MNDFFKFCDKSLQELNLLAIELNNVKRNTSRISENFTSNDKNTPKKVDQNKLTIKLVSSPKNEQSEAYEFNNSTEETTIKEAVDLIEEPKKTEDFEIEVKDNYEEVVLKKQAEESNDKETAIKKEELNNDQNEIIYKHNASSIEPADNQKQEDKEEEIFKKEKKTIRFT